MFEISIVFSKFNSTNITEEIKQKHNFNKNQKQRYSFVIINKITKLN